MFENLKEPRNIKHKGCPVYTKNPRIACRPMSPAFWDCRYDSECENRKEKCCREGPCEITTCMKPVCKF